MKKNIGLFISISLLFSFTYGASCNEIENTIGTGNECYCIGGLARNDTKTKCIKIDTSLRDAELKKAIEWMHANGLTQYSTPENFGSDDYITREQAAKIFSTFYSKVLDKKFNENVNLNVFSDINKANPDLRYYIFQANDMGLFKGIKGQFLPKNKLTQAQAISVAIRMVNGNLEEIKNARYTNYYIKAKKYGLLKRGNFDIIDLSRTSITRGDVALLLYTLDKHITDNKNNVAIDYNYDLTTSINKCLDAEEKNINAFESGTEEEMNNAINEILDICKDSAKEIYNIGILEENDSLQKAMLTVIAYNISFYNKAKEIIPYKRLANPTEAQEIESDKIGEILNNLIERFDESFENLKNIQKEFKNDYGFGTTQKETIEIFI